MICGKNVSVICKLCAMPCASEQVPEFQFAYNIGKKGLNFRLLVLGAMKKFGFQSINKNADLVWGF